ncbi:hypothetical protein PsorP6_017113 [Peronosclerospora sorghi]|uniref:Uncharacterized protein n=1 Tax=Peronosclerospora sorghi TaxID=230839 RepID=A0ACC0WDI4_9STRA|nr:hypothetical protein PsorP6_017113 [Peronosclerospora sorghi]
MQSVASVAVVASLVAAVQASSGASEPGYCKNDKSCESSYVCISVQTTRSGIEDVKQCLPYKAEGDVCSGTFPGLCPSFSTWNTAFQSISSVCAYQLPSGTDKCLNSTSADSDKKGYVSCMDITKGKGSKAKSVGVIYGCVDFDGTNLLFEKDSDNMELSSQMNYTAIINEGCVNRNNGTNSDVVCSGRGTCAPSSSGSMDYRCVCNVGYNGTYCEQIVSNKCTLKSQCQAGTCNLKTQECECEPGTTGDQCAYCDPTSSKACNGHGTCIPAPTATDQSTSNSSSTSTGSTNSSSTGSTLLTTAGSTNSSSTGSTHSTSAGSTDLTSAGATHSTSAGAKNSTSIGHTVARSSSTTSPTGSLSGDQSDVEKSDSSATRFLMEAVGMASSSDGASGNVCKCESGYTGDQCTRKVESSGSDKKKSSSSPSSSGTASMATSIAVLVSAFVVASIFN